MNMTSGIDLKELAVGTGARAERGKVAFVHIRTFLNRGEERLNTYAQDRPTQIHLGKREAIAGLEQGIEGMKVGGRRELIISPHLAYGEKGIPGSIPPNAILRCEVELVEVREPDERKPEDFPPGKQIVIIRTGETAKNLVRWQFGVREDGNAGLIIQKVPPSGATWRHMRFETAEAQLTEKERRCIFEEILAMPEKFPDEVIPPTNIGMDASSEKANSIPRDSKTDTACLSITVWERGVYTHNYYLRENSPALLGSLFYKIATKTVNDHLQKETKMT